VGRWAPVLAILACATLAPHSSAQIVSMAPGEVLERATSPSDTSQHWALFVPSRYDGTRDIPILFLMDPRGRAMLPMQRARVAAERYGWAVMSSYNTMSDGPVEPNVRALSVMLDDAQSLLRLDTRRLYLAGFSGTARIAWAIAPRLDSAVAGIFGAGAGTPVRAAWLAGPDAPRVAFFGSAGTTDFNFDEVMDLERWLRTGNHSFALRAFTGAHEWPPEYLFDDAIAWFELQAMQSGRAPSDQPFADSLFSAWMARADSLARSGTAPDILYGLDPPRRPAFRRPAPRLVMFLARCGVRP
jgi:predicted esterase